MTTKEQIRQLYSEGKTPPEIKSITGLCKSTVHYHLYDNTKQQTLERTKRSRKKNPGQHKLYAFLERKSKEEPRAPAKMRRKALTNKSRKFQQRVMLTKKGWRKHTSLPITFTFDDIVALHPEKKCYLTGRPIDFTKTETFSFDHIIPITKRGPNTLDNLGVACPEANGAKNALTVEEFVKLCKDVLVNFGYVVYRNWEEDLAGETGTDPVRKH